MDGDTGLVIDYQVIGRNGRVRLTARLPDGTTYTDKIDVADADGRRRFLQGLCKGRKGIDRKAVAAELERIASAVVAKPAGDAADGESDMGKPSQADLLVKLARDAELFHTPGGNDSEGYATVVVDDHHETWPVNSKGFKRWLSRLFYVQFGKVPGSQALQDAITVIAGIAIHEGPEHAIAVRIAEHDGAIWLDLAKEKWEAVQVTSSGWRVVADPPVKFIRKRGMLALPYPVSGGHICQLRPLVNLPDDQSWALFVAWLVAAFRPGRPFPVLIVNGEQGSAKSTVSKMARALIDPNTAPLRRPPRDDRDLMIAATNGWIVAYDNLSSIPNWLSDALCQLATGGGFGTRELYTDAEEKLFDATRPIMLNGIDVLATRPDLLDRALTVIAPEISDERRRDEDEVWEEFNGARPHILGSLLDAVSTAMRNRPGLMLTSKPRMADFACWVVAAEPALEWPTGTFMDAYTQNRGRANAEAIESAIIAPVILSLMESRICWTGTVRELLAKLEGHTDEKTQKRKEWPKTPKKLSGDLRRLAPNLRRIGVNVTFGKHTRTGTPITLGWIAQTPSPSSPSQSGTEHGDDPTEQPSPEPSPPKAFAGRFGDDREGGDGLLCSGSDAPERADEVVEWTA